MTVKRWMSAAVVAALVSGSVPARAAGEESTQGAGDRAVNLNASIARAAERAAAEQSKKPMQRPMFASATAGQAASGSSGGGGGHTAMIISLVSLAAGIGVTYYAVKQMQKTTNDINQQVAAAK